MENSKDNIKDSIFTSDMENWNVTSKSTESLKIKYLESIDFNHELPAKLNRFTLIHIVEGEGSFKLAMESYRIKRKSLYFGYPGQLISAIKLHNITGFVLNADVNFMLQANPNLLDHNIFQQYGKRHEFNLSNEYNEKLLSISKDLLYEYEQKKYERDKILHSLVFQHVLITDRILYEGQSKEERNLHPIVKSFFAMMNFKENVNAPVSEYANALNISPNYLNSLVKNQIGKSVKVLLKEKTIRQACVMLIHTNLEIKEIAYNLDYNYPQYFASDFKKAMNQTPLEYREKHS